MPLALPAIALILIVAQSPVTQPASQPASSAESSQEMTIGVALANLDSPSAETREAGFRSLLALKRADLPELLSTVRAAAPMSQGALSLLRRVVIHVYLSEEPFDAVEGGALGISLEEVTLPGPASEEGSERSAVLVTECRPGFAAYRYLEPGDLITGIVGGQERFDRQSFGGIIRRTGANRPITLRVLRRGKNIDVTVILSRRPPELDNQNGLLMPLYSSEWVKRGEDYWMSTFVPVVGGDEGP